jgi:hypothetical protein
VKTRVRTHRALRLVLLCVGGTGLVLGVGLAANGLADGNRPFVKMGAAYVLAALALLGTREVILLTVRLQRNRCRLATRPAGTQPPGTAGLVPTDPRSAAPDRDSQPVG